MCPQYPVFKPFTTPSASSCFISTNPSSSFLVVSWSTIRKVPRASSASFSCLRACSRQCSAVCMRPRQVFYLLVVSVRETILKVSTTFLIRPEGLYSQMFVIFFKTILGSSRDQCFCTRHLWLNKLRVQAKIETPCSPSSNLSPSNGVIGVKYPVVDILCK